MNRIALGYAMAKMEHAQACNLPYHSLVRSQCYAASSQPHYWYCSCILESVEGWVRVNILTDEQDINSSEIEIVEIGHCCHAFAACMHSSVKLQYTLMMSMSVQRCLTYHDSLALILQNMA